MNQPVAYASYELSYADTDAAASAYPIMRHFIDRQEFDTINLRPPALVLELEDLTYHHDSAVTLPCAPGGLAHNYQPEPWQRDELTDALQRHHPPLHSAYLQETLTQPLPGAVDWRRNMVILAVTYHFMQHNPAYRLLLAGHTDASGSDTVNFTLSDLRARNVYCLLTGDRAGWVSITLQRSRIVDYQQILQYCAQVNGWPCNPGAVDGDHGPLTDQAVRRFQAVYNQTFGAAIAEDGVVGEVTWGAFFDVYMAELAALLDESSAESLDGYRSALRFVDPDRPWIGCGERVPLATAVREPRSQANRRVEVLFFPTGALPDLSAHLDGGVLRTAQGEPADSGVYGPGLFQFMTIRPQWWTAQPPAADYQPRLEIITGETVNDVDANEAELVELSAALYTDDPYASFDYYPRYYRTDEPDALAYDNTTSATGANAS